MYANVYDLKMPARYADMSVVEMEYDGTGFFNWGPVGNVLGAVALLGASVAGVCAITPAAPAAPFIAAGAGVVGIAAVVCWIFGW